MNPKTQIELAKKAMLYVPLQPGQTVDELAYGAIYLWLEQHHKPILDHLKAQMQADDQFRLNYSPKPF